MLTGAGVDGGAVVRLRDGVGTLAGAGVDGGAVVRLREGTGVLGGADDEVRRLDRGETRSRYSVTAASTTSHTFIRRSKA